MERRAILAVCAASALFAGESRAGDPGATSGTLAGVVTWRAPNPDGRILHSPEYSCGVELNPDAPRDATNIVARCAIAPPEGARVLVVWNLEAREWKVVSITWTSE